ncbi:hypothetical protein QBZ16_000233 [Prototheca wickerhamii]|uniref:Class II aldolase/adducin N-terminal domain-containing protein n=1 Tax=Prototheca wickerhamii TaxID=3111 RepID=A0AAD9IMW0_PROWI|nr:hypothetical protein QBZ16_000233 [Prototheca wickerhamii]
MAPSGVQKERMRPEDMFVLDRQGNVVETPEPRGPPYKPPKLSECAPLFQSAYDLAGAGAVLHGHSHNALLATVLDPGATEFRITEVEMIKGIEGHGFYDTLVVPIIENTARECELTDRLQDAIRRYPRTRAAKTQAECYEYLFQAAVELRRLGLERSAAPAAKRARVAAPAPASHVVLDIEGTVAPISFVADVLFPYARARLRPHLEATWDEAGTRAAVASLRARRNGAAVAGLGAEPGERAGEIAAVVAWAEGEMDADRKTPELKTLQGHIWTAGFRQGELQAPLFPDVEPALRRWVDAGAKLYIYSSGSRQAQRDLFAHTSGGDLRPLLSAYFDTSSGVKVEAASYHNIALSLGVDDAQSLLFLTDNPAEARAALEAGWKATLVQRPGNKELSAEEAKSTTLITSFDEI